MALNPVLIIFFNFTSSFLLVYTTQIYGVPAKTTILEKTEFSSCSPAQTTDGLSKIKLYTKPAKKRWSKRVSGLVSGIS